MNRMISVAGIRRRKQGRASSFGRVTCFDVQRQEQVSRNRLSIHRTGIAKSERSRNFLFLREESPKGETHTKEKRQTETARFGPISGQMVTPLCCVRENQMAGFLP